MTRLAAQQSGSGRVVGLDLSADMLRVARGVTHVGGISIEWYEGSALALPFKDGAFNIVLCQLGCAVHRHHFNTCSAVSTA